MRLAGLGLVLEERLYTRLRGWADRRSPLPAHLLTGRRGEEAAFFHLRSLGYTVVGRRWRSARLRGDLDLVAWDPGEDRAGGLAAGGLADGGLAGGGLAGGGTAGDGLQGATLVFVEVKTRVIAPGYTQPFLPAWAAVDSAKQRQLRWMGAAFLRQLPQEYRESVRVRFDVLSVHLEGGATPAFALMRSAFPVTEPDRRRRGVAPFSR